LSSGFATLLRTAGQVVDGLEFLSAAIMVSVQVPLFSKICLLFSLFDLDKTGGIRKDEFTIFLKSVTTGLNRMHTGLPPPSSVQELSAISAQFFSTLPGQVVSKQEFLMWMTEKNFSLHYLAVLSRLGSAIFATGTNHRHQLGFHLEPRVQRVPSPMLTMEGITISSIASHESHSLFLTQEGRIWTCGSGFCGILGHGSISDSFQPKLIESLLHVRIVDVAVGVRHSVAVSEKGQIFTWGAADLGQLGHGSTEDREVHERSYDPQTGGDFAYVTKPTVVMGLFGKKIFVRKASCCNFTTVALSDQGQIYSWGNNTDGQCGHGQKCFDHRLVYIDPHMHRTAMQAIFEPRLVQTDAIQFGSIKAGGYHVLAVDMQSRLWTWGQGLWGKLGHGDQQAVYKPRLVEALKHHICQAIAAGESHSACLCAMYRLNITSSSASLPLGPVSYLGLPAGRVDRQWAQQKLVTPPDIGFASARLLEVGLPFKYDPDHAIFQKHSPADVQNSIVLMARSLCQGDWLKLSTSEVDFRVRMSSAAAPLEAVRAPIILLSEKWEVADCTAKICVFELSRSLAQATQILQIAGANLTNSTQFQDKLQETILQIATQCQQGSGRACLCILPQEVSEFDIIVPEHLRSVLSAMPLGVIDNKSGKELSKHLEHLKNVRIAETADGLPDEVRGWEERQESSGGGVYYENATTGQRRTAAPQVNSGAQATLVTVQEDFSLQWLKDIVANRPKGIIVSQTSWRPDVELLDLPSSFFNLESLDTAIVVVSFEVGEELRKATAASPCVTMEFQQTGGVCAWGNGSYGQLGLAGIENRNFLQTSQNALTGEENTFVDRPCYVAHLHEHEVTDLACGAAHTVAVTAPGEVFTWGAAEGLGVPISEHCSGVPVIVGQLEGFVKAAKAFAGHQQTFIKADMPFKSVV